jgi:hypothetical protein
MSSINNNEKIMLQKYLKYKTKYNLLKHQVGGIYISRVTEGSTDYDEMIKILKDILNILFATLILLRLKKKH